jgi:hypothetical protein
VLRGASGLANFLGQNPGTLGEVPVFVVPVIFSTADLLCSDTDLGDSDLKSGKTPEAPLTSRPWIWFQHNLSSALEHSLQKDYGHVNLSSVAQALRFRYARSLAIVSPLGIGGFLKEIVTCFEKFHPPL